MSPIDSASAFEAFAFASRVHLPTAGPALGLARLLDFYASVPVSGCSGESGDMLLFQWGTYDWGDGPTFEVNLTRQFIESDKQDDDAISQLLLTYFYAPSPALASLGAGNRWCESPDERASFGRFVLESPSVVAVEALPARVELRHEYV